MFPEYKIPASLRMLNIQNALSGEIQLCIISVLFLLVGRYCIWFLTLINYVKFIIQ